MRDRGTCEAYRCERPAIGYRANGLGVVNLCENHLPENRREGDEEVVCDVCIKPNQPDETGELRCTSCDEAIDTMARSDWEDAVAEGRA